MTIKKRLPGEKSRARLIKAAVHIINTRGYAELSARTLAEHVGLKRQIVHYYFRTMDDLLLAVIRHFGEEGLARMLQALADQDPLRAIWDVNPDASATTFSFMAMANHRPAVRREMLKYLNRLRDMQCRAISQYLETHSVKSALPPIVLAIVVQGISQTLSAESALGSRKGHLETRTEVSKWLQKFSGRPVKSGRPKY